MKKFVQSFIVVLFIALPLHAAEFNKYDSPVRAEVISEKAFVRADHDDTAKRLVTLEEGDALSLIGEWNSGDAFPWYAVMVKSETGWIYGQNIQRLDGKPTAPAQTAATQTAQGQETSMPEAGLLASDANYVTVIAHGQGVDRQKALEQAWIEAVRLAVGAIISSKSELNNDEFAENTIAHSRGVIESFDIVGEKNDGKRLTVAIQAKVRKETLIEVAKNYGEAQTVKAQTEAVQEVVKMGMDDKAKASTAEAKQKSGFELIKEVLESYPAEMFYSATLDPKIYMDKNKKPYLNIVQKFNEDLFWKEFLPKLRTALDGVAEKKEKRKYESFVQQAHRDLAKERHAEQIGIYSDAKFIDKYGEEFYYNTKTPYSWAEKKEKNEYPTGGFINSAYSMGNVDVKEPFLVIVPENNTEYTVYYLPCEVSFKGGPSSELTIAYEPANNNSPEKNQLYYLFADYVKKACLPLAFSIIYVDGDGYEIRDQTINIGAVMNVVYRSFCYANRWEGNWKEYGLFPERGVFAFSPGFVNKNENRYDFYLDTTKFKRDYSVALDEEDLQKVDSMTFEVIASVLPAKPKVGEVGAVIPFGGYNWRVLDVQGSRALIITEHVIEQRPYNVEGKAVTWETCTLREYLNSTFYNSFSAEEKARIAEARIINNKNPSYNTPGGNETADKIFLLSLEEANKYFSNDSARKAVDSKGSSSWWWLRSPGSYSILAANVNYDGSVDVDGYNVDAGSGSVRPALWLNL